jgi:hypothetical protein
MIVRLTASGTLAVTVVAGKHAWQVQADGANGWSEQPVPARLI